MVRGGFRSWVYPRLNRSIKFNDDYSALKIIGTLIFCEHGKSPDEITLKWQNRINPYLYFHFILVSSVFFLFVFFC